MKTYNIEVILERNPGFNTVMYQMSFRDQTSMREHCEKVATTGVWDGDNVFIPASLIKKIRVSESFASMLDPE